MGGALENATRQLFDALDRKDAEAIIRSASQEVQMVDEISRKWQRGIDAAGSYFRQAMGTVDDIHSTINDVHESVLGDTGLVTCWLEQDYTLEGNRTHVSAPTSLVFRRDNDAWKVVLIHTIPMPPDEK
ncbi:MAG TPA: nuclear transport factor 2 family protein [Candidatus Dormibacteraeota bacterium]|nr:nuclear transport factor 2 family protein [Candidatus Dormibacteraeota bacterium]